MQGGKRMWKMQNDAESAQPERAFPLRQRPDLSSDGDALVKHLMNEQFQQVDFAAPEKASIEDSHHVASPNMKKYAEAVAEFTKNATAFIEQLPLLTKARGAYEEAMRASAEMRRVLDASDENLRILMSKLEQNTNLQELKSAADKKPPEPARVETLKATDNGGERFRWP
ncbi:MAG TPA: hypothetical protein VJS37_08970 [Terriglobales bacterium]|nr:hypothetical protein [Terriglobales bacterium]